MASVQIRGIKKQFGSTQVIRGVDIDIEDGQFAVLVGPSGCGKSTLLRMLAGLEEITEGEISIGGTVVNNVQPKDRDIAMVFQNYALYPHMTVNDNVWRWAVRSYAIRRSSCSMNRCPILTPSCACKCAPRSKSCISA